MVTIRWLQYMHYYQSNQRKRKQGPARGVYIRNTQLRGERTTYKIQIWGRVYMSCMRSCGEVDDMVRLHLLIVI